MLPVGFALVLLQGISEIIKRIGWLMTRLRHGHRTTRRPLQ